MTSELFYRRRSRVRLTRASEINIIVSESSSSPSPEHHVHRRRRRRRILHHRHESSARSPHVRHPADRGSLQFEQANGYINSISTELRSTNGRPGTLPGNVLLARERLLERLRGVSISENGQTNSAFSSSSRGNNVSRNDSRLLDVGNWGLETSDILPAAGYRSLDMTLQTYSSRLPRESKKPPGLTQEDINSLYVKAFSKKEDELEGKALEASCDCGICLECFLVGDELIYLPCGHKFHSACLIPWIRTCGDCPYCRTDVTVAC